MCQDLISIYFCGFDFVCFLRKVAHHQPYEHEAAYKDLIHDKSALKVFIPVHEPIKGLPFVLLCIVVQLHVYFAKEYTQKRMALLHHKVSHQEVNKASNSGH